MGYSGILSVEQLRRCHNLKFKRKIKSQFESVGNVCSTHMKTDGNIIRTGHECKPNSYKIEVD